MRYNKVFINLVLPTLLLLLHFQIQTTHFRNHKKNGAGRRSLTGVEKEIWG